MDVKKKSILDNDDVDISETPLLSSHQEHFKNNDASQSIKSPFNVDDIVEGLKLGPFHYFFVLICGLCHSIYITTYSVIGFILITACDLNIAPSSKGWLSLCFTIGVGCSSPIFGKLSDTFGRWKIITISVTMYITSVIVATFSYNYMMLLVMFFVIGIAIGGLSTVSASYTIEFFPRSYRGMAVGSRLVIAIITNAYVCLIALLILPHSFNTYIGVIYFSSWRIFLILSLIPIIFAYIALLFMPETMRFVIVKGNIKNITKTFNRVNQINSCCGSHDNSSYHETLSLLLKNSDQIVGNHECDRHFNNVSQTKEKLYNKPWIIRFILLCLAWLGVGFGVEGFTMWLPTLLNFYSNGNTCRHQAHDNVSWPVMHAILQHSNGSFCAGNGDLTHVITNILYGSILAIPFAIFCLFTINRLGRKWLFCITICVIGICQFVMWLIDNALAASIIGIIFSMLSNCVWISLTTWTVELFPTTMRSTTVGILNIFSLFVCGIGMVVVGLIFAHNCTITIFLFTFFSIIGGLVSLYLPDTTNLDIK